ncbi:hypothetical protein PDJAM_G00010030 [Pangasius djambal]|uniref:Uncharacterized protein n=1 Tax=Pangasius djambal TaxID=1691987 RepID=A0ACC5XZP0_9TELE|nr:hypothetical protein [Pangasius djambal]
MSKFVLLAVVMVLQVCLTMADVSANAPESQGVLQRAKEAYKELKTKVVDAGSTAVEFVHLYYEDQLKPVTDPYIEWVKEKARSLWDKVKDKVSSDESS